jgi:gliding motility-associated-like protein
LTPQGGTAPYSFLWSNGATTEDSAGLVAGNYSVAVTDANNCTANLAASVTQPAAALTLGAQVTDVLCFGNATGQIDLTPQGGTAPYSFLWSNGATTEDVSGLVAGAYGVNVIDANQCLANLLINVIQPSSGITLTSQVTNVLCAGNTTGQINLTPQGGTAPYSFVWSNGAMSEDIGSLAVGNYTVQVTDAQNCTATHSATVQLIHPQIDVTAQIVPAHCFGASTGAIYLNITGGSSPYSILWSNGFTGEDLINTPAGVYQVGIQDINNCFVQHTYQVGQSGQMSITGVVQSPSCHNTSDGQIHTQVLGGAAPFNFQWNIGATTSFLQGIPSGTYEIEVTDAQLCQERMTFTVVAPDTLDVTGVVKPNVCEGDLNGEIIAMASGGTGPYQLTWENGQVGSHRFNLGPGTYVVQALDQNGCFAQETFTIVPVPPIQAFDDQQEHIIFSGESVQLQPFFFGGETPYTFSWSPFETLSCSDCMEPWASPPITTEYTVQLIDARGCMATAKAKVIVLHDLYIPNAFTPNGDGKNDFFGAEARAVVEYELLIFNRWGELIFESNDIERGWDGMYLGAEAQEGVYSYKLYAKMPNGDRKRAIGRVTLLR